MADQSAEEIDQEPTVPQGGDRIYGGTARHGMRAPAVFRPVQTVNDNGWSRLRISIERVLDRVARDQGAKPFDSSSAQAAISPSSSISMRMKFPRQQRGQSSTYSCSFPCVSS